MKTLQLSVLGLILTAGCAQPTSEPVAASAAHVARETPSPTADKPAVLPPPAEFTAVELATINDDLPPDVLALVAPLSPEQVRQRWINLFDGKSLFGWTSSNEGVNWSVVEGHITADSGPPGLLLTDVPFADFELHCEFNMAAGGNSGVFLRSIADPHDVQTDCYELNIVDEHPGGFLTGSLVGRQLAVEPLQGSGGWKNLDVRCEGDRITASLDGRPVLDFQDTSTGIRRSGRLGLQKNSGRIEFRAVLLRPLGMNSQFNGRDLEGWRMVPGAAGGFSVVAGEIQGRGGPAFLESVAEYGDFILQLDCATLGPAVNSGVFFRAQAGTASAPSNGYELQINNARQQGDRSRPADAGTGAIFRRAEARILAADDLTWATVTLVAAGPQMSSWVNGYPVVDWSDDRAPDDNPRKGRRDAPGHLSLQLHDASSAVIFRDFRVSPLPSADP